jgi:hypothetical protein
MMIKVGGRVVYKIEDVEMTDSVYFQNLTPNKSYVVNKIENDSSGNVFEIQIYDDLCNEVWLWLNQVKSVKECRTETIDKLLDETR